MKPMQDIPLQSLCQGNPLVNKFFWPENIAYENFKYFCEIVNGKLYIANHCEIYGKIVLHSFCNL